jgi:hypothetical protein
LMPVLPRCPSPREGSTVKCYISGTVITGVGRRDSTPRTQAAT